MIKSKMKTKKEILKNFEMNSGTETESYLHFRYGDAPFGYRPADIEDIAIVIDQAEQRGMNKITGELWKRVDKGDKDFVKAYLHIIRVFYPFMLNNHDKK